MDAEAATGYSAARALPPGARPWIAACVLRWWLGIGTVIGLLLGLVAAALLSGWSGGSYSGSVFALGVLLGFGMGLLIAAPQAITLAAGARRAFAGTEAQFGLAAGGATVTVLFWYLLVVIVSGGSLLAYGLPAALIIWLIALAIGVHALFAVAQRYSPLPAASAPEPVVPLPPYMFPPPAWSAPTYMPAARQPEPLPAAPAPATSSAAPSPVPRPAPTSPGRRERLLSHHRPTGRVAHPRA